MDTAESVMAIRWGMNAINHKRVMRRVARCSASQASWPGSGVKSRKGKGWAVTGKSLIVYLPAKDCVRGLSLSE